MGGCAWLYIIWMLFSPQSILLPGMDLSMGQLHAGTRRSGGMPPGKLLKIDFHIKCVCSASRYILPWVALKQVRFRATKHMIHSVEFEWYEIEFESIFSGLVHVYLNACTITTWTRPYKETNVLNCIDLYVEMNFWQIPYSYMNICITNYAKTKFRSLSNIYCIVKILIPLILLVQASAYYMFKIFSY